MFSLKPPRHIPTLPRLCENASGRRLLRIDFSFMASRWTLRALLIFVSAKLRRKFYFAKERRSFHTA